MTQAAQCERLLTALSNRAMTAVEIFQELGIYRASARVQDLRADGHVIHSTRITVHNKFGEPCLVAQYSIPTNQKLLIPLMPGRARYSPQHGKKEPRA